MEEVYEIKFEKVERVKNLEFDLPMKATKYAAGYDFINPEDVWVTGTGVTYVKTGIKAKFPNHMALLLLNRSSNPKKKELFLANGIGLVDADYYNNEDNEGEIAFAFMTTNGTGVFIPKGEKLGQGMFINYYDISSLDKNEISERKGGFGSTSK